MIIEWITFHLSCKFQKLMYIKGSLVDNLLKHLNEILRNILIKEQFQTYIILRHIVKFNWDLSNSYPLPFMIRLWQERVGAHAILKTWNSPIIFSTMHSMTLFYIINDCVWLSRHYQKFAASLFYQFLCRCWLSTIAKTYNRSKMKNLNFQNATCSFNFHFF